MSHMGRIEGNAASQTIVVFVNRAVTSQAAPEGTTPVYSPDKSGNLAMFWNDVLDMILVRDRRFQAGSAS